jgi:hypothetical protein
MEIEQLPPKRPNFLLIVVLSSAFMLVVFGLALAFVHFDGRHLHFGDRHNRDQAHAILLPPPAPSSYRAAPV